MRAPLFTATHPSRTTVLRSSSRLDVAPLDSLEPDRRIRYDVLPGLVAARVTVSHSVDDQTADAVERGDRQHGNAMNAAGKPGRCPRYAARDRR